MRIEITKSQEETRNPKKYRQGEKSKDGSYSKDETLADILSKRKSTLKNRYKRGRTEGSHNLVRS